MGQLQGQEVAVLPSRMWLWHGEGMVPCIVWVGRCLQRGSLCGIGPMYSEHGCRAEMWWGSLGGATPVSTPCVAPAMVLGRA